VQLRRKKATIIATFDDIELTLLMALLDQLDELIDAMADDDPPTQRLFPAGYRDDERAGAEFRELTQASLQQERRDRYGQCRAELPRTGGPVVITPDTAQRWLIVLNDMRLALGTRLGVSAEPFEDLDPDDPLNGARAMYYWLTGVQDQLISQVMRLTASVK